jgi:cold shock protein
MRAPHERVSGTVRDWYGEEGWGVVLTPDGLTTFCHFSDVEMDGYRTLSPGDRVEFDYETPGQDGCDARVRTSARPIG